MAARARIQIASALLTVTGMFFMACALLYNPFTVSLAVRVAPRILGRPWTATPEAGDILRMEGAFAVAGIACILARWIICRSPRLDRFFRRSVVEKLLLAFLAFAVPVTTLEIALRPLTSRPGKDTSLFVLDEALGWRMRSSATQEWGGVVVTTNEHGLRGPAVPMGPHPGLYRILWLGDSVTFGYGLRDHEETFAYAVERRLEELGHAVETVNAGVGGYSPWQQAIWLESEGRHYLPDLVVIGFVLNDVTEKFTLVRFGGQSEATQLRASYYSRFDRLFARSALVSQVRNITRWVKARRRLGTDPQLGAVRREILDVETLIHRPDQANVDLAWDMTKTNLDGIVRICRDRGFGLLVAVFPFAVQLEEPVGMRAPQDVMVAWAAENNVACIDLLPVLAAHTASGVAAADLFIDHDHLSAAGHRVVADTLSKFILPKLEQRPNEH